MRAVLQRVSKADITINHAETRSIGEGLVLFLGVMEGDIKENAQYLAKKICDLRIFTDENDKLNLSLKDIGGDILIVSNFTLSADCRHGRRPSFERAAKGDTAKSMYEYFVSLVKADSGIKNVQTGEFGAHMDIMQSNNGPITIIMDTDNIAKH